jgi:four helix bundle protein
LAHSYRQLIAWQKAKQLAVNVCILVRRFPKDELYGLTSQVRRAAVSIPCNIAEGQGRLTKGEFAHFLGIARGSLLEVQTLLEIALDLGYISTEQHSALEKQHSEVLRVLNGLLDSVQSKARNAGVSS